MVVDGSRLFRLDVGQLGKEAWEAVELLNRGLIRCCFSFFFSATTGTCVFNTKIPSIIQYQSMQIQFENQYVEVYEVALHCVQWLQIHVL
jgi:hypothetical protein